MRNFKYRLSNIALMLMIISALPISSTMAIDSQATITTTHYVYLPIVMNRYKSPPPTTISHYISWGQSDLTYQRFYDMGKTLGQSVPSGFWGYVILQFGQPWKEGQVYKIRDYAYVTMTISDVEYFTKGYLKGFYDYSPSDAFLITVVGLTNQGSYFYNDPQGFGYAWGTMISNIVNWINTPPSYAGKLAIAGGIDNELGWNNANKSLSWKYAYIANASRFYFYYGNCDSCPYEDQPDWSPEPLGWTLEQVYEMSNGASSYALPQIYRTDRQHAEQWYYLSLYIYLQGQEPIGFMGSLTQWSACSEVGGCSSGYPDATDNTPGQGWEQLWGEISSDPRTSQSRMGIPFDLPVSTDISWNHWRVTP
jgi:hypothetical protein